MPVNQTLTNHDGTKTVVTYVRPAFTTKRDVNFEKKLTKEQRRDRNAAVIIQNDELSYLVVPRYLADEMIDENKAIEIKKDDPDYFRIWKLAYGYPKGKGGQAHGEFIPYAAMIGDDHDAEYQELLEMERKKGGRAKAFDSQATTESGILVPVGANTDVVQNVRPRGRPRKILIPSKR